MKRILSVSLVLSAVGGAHAVAADDIEVMTYNQYLGADFTALGAARDLPEFNGILLEILEQIAATDVRARLQRQAEQIAKRLPDLVGLQEVWEIRCFPLKAGACDDPSIAGAFGDHLEETMLALDASGVDYEVAATVKNLALEGPLQLPLDVDGGGFDALLTVVDRDAILARADASAEPVFLCPESYRSEDGCNYRTAIAVSTPVGGVSIKRGFVAVDATVDGRGYRFVNTHLEIREPQPGNPLSRFFQFAQAMELIEVLDATAPTWPLILVGDINSSPEDEPVVVGPSVELAPPYMLFTENAGYTDIWTLRPGAVAGFSCCQDKDLTNEHSSLVERIDMIFSSDPPAQVKQARVVGADVADKTPPPGLGLWPSDHGGVAAGLRF